MSNTTGLSRTRSFRNPPSRETDSVSDKSRNERNTSPSQVPMRPLARANTVSAAMPASTTTSRLRGTTISARQNSLSKPKSSLRLIENAASAAVKPVSRTASIRQAPSTATTNPTALSRTMSVTRPKSSESNPIPAPKANPLVHSRSKSTITTLTTATTLRPLSGVNAPSRSNPSPAPSTASSTSTTTQSKRTQASSQSNSTTAAAAAVPALTRRPAFNTNQQHYTPAKSQAPKPLTATFLAPPSPSKQPVNVAISAETSRLQTELLQLSLLHRDAHATTQAWHESARSKLQNRFEEIAAADQALRTMERDAAETRGLQDLERWGDAERKGTGRSVEDDADDREKGDMSLDERIRLLDHVLNGVWALGEPNSRYQRVAGAFEEWAHRAAEIRAAQDGGDVDALLACGDGGGEENGAGIFVSDLDADVWRRDHAGLVRLLAGWRKMLAQLGSVGDDEEDGEAEAEKTKPTDGNDGDEHKESANAAKPRSGLARALRGCRCLVRDMLAELDVMEQIERAALAAEEEWMEAVETQLSSGEDGDDDSRRQGNAEDVLPWKMLVF